MMLGGFAAFSLIAGMGLNYWAGAAARHRDHGRRSVFCSIRRAAPRDRPAAICRDHADARPRLHLPRFRRHHLRLRLRDLRDAVHQQGRSTSAASSSARTACRSSSARFCCARVLYLFFSKTRLGIAMQAASQNQLAAYCMGIPVRTIFSLIWAISAAVVRRRRHPARAEHGARREHGLPGLQGLRGRGARRLRQHSGRAGRRRHHRHRRAAVGLLPARWLPGSHLEHRASCWS